MLINQFAANSYEAVNTGADIASILFGLFFTVAILALVIFMVVLWVMSLVHLIQNEDVKDRILWIVLLLLIGSLMGPIYWYAIKKPYDKKHPSKKK